MKRIATNRGWTQGRDARVLRHSAFLEMNPGISGSRVPRPATFDYCQSGTPFVFVLVFVQLLLISILLPEQLIIRLLPNSLPPIIRCYRLGVKR